ncbi:MAG: hypothetical protein EXQ74_00205 [Thermoleophilia bacterium]|nr:hypothetical protein [Thermoleophilia bacterium]
MSSAPRPTRWRAPWRTLRDPIHRGRRDGARHPARPRGPHHPGGGGGPAACEPAAVARACAGVRTDSRRLPAASRHATVCGPGGDGPGRARR